MVSDKIINSVELERLSIAGLIKHKEIFGDVIQFLSENDFTFEPHRILFTIIKQKLEANKEVNATIIVQEIKNASIKFKDVDDIFAYVSEGIMLLQTTGKGCIEAVKELKKITIARELVNTARKEEEIVRKNLDKPAQEIIDLVDEEHNSKICRYYIEENPVDLFNFADNLIAERGNNPTEEMGLITPHSSFNKIFGGLRNGQIYVWASRTGQGKSTFLCDIALKTAIANKIKILYLDTEMYDEDVSLRLISSLSGCPFWYLDTGMFMKNKELYDKVQSARKTIQSYKFTFYHKFVANKSIEEVIQLIRRWYYSQCGRGNQAIIVYDYLKLTGEKVSNDWKEYQVIGEKTNRLKELASNINAPILTAIQINRGGVVSNRKAIETLDDESVIAISDRVSWFAGYLGIFRRKSLEEIADDGVEFGSHKLITLKSRFQGRNSYGHQDLIKIESKDGIKYKLNFLSYSVENFNVIEKGSLRDIIEKQNRQLDISDKTEKSDEEVTL